MGSKGPLFGIMAFGLIAAIGAAVLLAALKAGPAGASAGQVTTVPVLVAALDLEPMTRIDESMVELRDVLVQGAPKQRLGDPSLVIGRVLKTAVLKGQTVTDGTLLDEQSGARLAMSLPDGFRAVAIELASSSGMRGLLYPGSRVDVIVAYRSRSVTPAARPSTTLLQNVRVLAVEDKTVFTVDDDEEESDTATATRTRSKSLMVTLLVDPQQARDLQAARDAGELSLSLRNPHDASLSTETGAPVPVITGDDDETPRTWQTTVIRGGRSVVETFTRTDNGFQTPQAGPDQHANNDAHEDPVDE